MPRCIPRPVVRLAVTAILMSGALLPRCHADVLLDYKTTSESYFGRQSEGGFQVWLGENAARLDLSGSVSYVVDLREKKMLILDHVQHVFQVLTLPVRLEQYFEGEEAANYEFAMSLKPTVKLDAQGPSDEVGEWRTDLYVWSIVNSPTHRIELKKWLSRDLKVDEGLYNKLMSSYNALSLGPSQWIDRVLEPEGIAVRTEYASERYQGTWRTTSVLDSIREHPASEERYRAPSSYSEKSFDASRYAVTIEGSN